MLICSVLYFILENTDSKSVSVYKDYFTKNQNSIINIESSQSIPWSRQLSFRPDPAADPGVIHLGGVQRVSAIPPPQSRGTPQCGDCEN